MGGEHFVHSVDVHRRGAGTAARPRRALVALLCAVAVIGTVLAVRVPAGASAASSTCSGQYDASGNPVLASSGKQVISGANGSVVSGEYGALDSSGKPILDSNGNQELVDTGGNVLPTDIAGQPVTSASTTAGSPVASMPPPSAATATATGIQSSAGSMLVQILSMLLQLLKQLIGSDQHHAATATTAVRDACSSSSVSASAPASPSPPLASPSSIPGEAPASSSPAATSGSCVTGGSGGAMQNATPQSFTGGGLTSQYQVFAQGVPAGQPAGLMLYMHGDGADQFHNPSDGGVPGMAAQAAAHRMITVSMLTPDPGLSWYTNGAANAGWVRALMDQVIFKQYNIDRSRFWLIGYSGGASFMAQYLVPLQSSMICGGEAVFFAGGGSPNGNSGPFDPSFVRNFRMHFYAGLNDNGAGGSYDALSGSQQASAYYQGQGFPVTTEHPPGIDHHNIPFAQVATQQLTQNAG